MSSTRRSALTVTDQGWPVRIRVAKDDLLDKARFRIFNAGKRLTRFRLGEKKDEINRMTVIEGDADLRIAL